MHKYYSNGQNITAEELGRYDIVITTYGIVASDWKKSGYDKEGLVFGEAGEPVKKKAKGEKRKKDAGLFAVQWKVGRLSSIMRVGVCIDPCEEDRVGRRTSDKESEDYFCKICL